MIKQLATYHDAVVRILAGVGGIQYKYTTADEFKAIKEIGESQLVYWCEMIQRLHACSATSLLRIDKWCEAATNAYEQKNYYGLCASLRGLIEACSDSFYTLARVLTPICDNYKTIAVALEGEAKTVLLSEKIENELIHYVFARKLTASEKTTFAPEHSAKQVREYLQALADPAVDALYAELCQVSHPSFMSLIPFMMETKELGLFLHRSKVDRELNDNLLDRHAAAIEGALKLGVVIAACGLRVVNAFPAYVVETLHASDDELRVLEDSGVWGKFEARMTASAKKPAP